jgi:pyruvate ferredoxin oxidoreductase gamma subunit
MVVVLDPGLLPIVNVTSGLKANGIVVVNTKKQAEQIRQEFGINFTIATVDATAIAKELLGVPITNTTMVGAVVKTAGIVELDSLLKPLEKRFGRLAERNANAMRRAYEETIIKEWKN